jgi:hypothetical protein
MTQGDLTPVELEFVEADKEYEQGGTGVSDDVAVLRFVASAAPA